MKCTICGHDRKIVLDDGKNKICEICSKDVFEMNSEGKVVFVSNLRDEWRCIYNHLLIR